MSWVEAVWELARARLFGAPPAVPAPATQLFARWEDLRLLSGLDRIAYDEQGAPHLRYTAIDPADKVIRCTCGRPDCWSTELLPLRGHMAELYRAILVCGSEGVFPDQEASVFAWPGVTEALQLAASIEDVFADPSFTDDSEAALWCRPAYERDQEEREAASKYAAALITFNFVWNAYERAIELSAGGAFGKDKIAARGRKIFREEPALTGRISALRGCYTVARRICIRREKLSADIEKTESAYEMNLAERSAELVRVFRNYIVHGDDGSPIEGAGHACARIYAVVRLLLILIQLLLLRGADGGVAVYSSVNADEDQESPVPAGLFLANLHRRKDLWWPAAADPAPASA